MTKDTQKPLELLSILKVAKEHIDGHPSVAEDAGSPERAFTYLLERVVNRMAGTREVPATMVASYLLQYPAEWESARVWSVYVLPAVADAVRRRKDAGRVDAVTLHGPPPPTATATNAQRTTAAIHAAVHGTLPVSGAAPTFVAGDGTVMPSMTLRLVTGAQRRQAAWGPAPEVMPTTQRVAAWALYLPLRSLT